MEEGGVEDTIITGLTGSSPFWVDVEVQLQVEFEI